jgi:hypothetical protein
VVFNLIGDDVIVRRDLNGAGTDFNVNVGHAVEIDCAPGGTVGNCGSVLLDRFTVDLTATAIVVTAQLTPQQAFSFFKSIIPATTFNGFQFLDLDYGVPIDAVSFTTFGSITGTPEVSFTGNSISLDLQGVSFTGLSGFTITAETYEQVVPVPAALPLAMTGAGLLFAIGRRRSRAKPVPQAV